MGTLNIRRESKVPSVANKAEYTLNGNRLFRSKTLTETELERLRVPAYSYLL